MLTPMTLPQVADALPVWWGLSTPQPLTMLGAPGLAKTSFCRTTACDVLATLLGTTRDAIAYVEFNAAQRDPIDVAGVALPAKDADGRWVTHYSRSALLCMLDQALAQPGIAAAVLNLDEITQCSADMVKTLRSVIDADTRTLGNAPLPPNVYVIATGNRLADKSGSTKLLAHAANATNRVEIGLCMDSWQDWAATRAPDPIHPQLIAAAALLQDEREFFASAVPAEDVQFCTPRSYARAAAAITQLCGGPEARLRETPLARRICAAAIGEEAAERLFSTLATMAYVPSAREIQTDPTTAKLPEATHYQHAAAAVALVTAQDGASATNAALYLLRLRPDLQVGAMADLLNRSHRKGWLLMDPAVSQFIADNAELLPLAEGIA